MNLDNTPFTSPQLIQRNNYHSLFKKIYLTWINSIRVGRICHIGHIMIHRNTSYWLGRNISFWKIRCIWLRKRFARQLIDFPKIILQQFRGTISSRINSVNFPKSSQIISLSGVIERGGTFTKVKMFRYICLYPMEEKFERNTCMRFSFLRANDYEL